MATNDSTMKVGAIGGSYLKDGKEKESTLSNISEKSLSYLKTVDSKANGLLKTGSTGTYLKQSTRSNVQSYIKNATEKESKLYVRLSDKFSYIKKADSFESVLKELYNSISLRGNSYQSRLDAVNPADTSTPQYGGLDVIFGNSGFEVTGGTTIYLAQGSDSTEAEVRIPMPACTMKELRVSSSLPPGTGQTFTYTLMRNGNITSELEAQVSGSGVSASITLSNGIGFNAGDTFSIRLVTSSTAATAYHAFSVKII